MTTGERIRSLRIRAGMTQEELGQKIGVQKAAIHKYENDIVVNIKQTTLIKLAEALNTSGSYLIGMPDALPPDAIPYVPGKRIPIIGIIPAGSPMLAVEEIEGFAFADVPDPENYLFLRVRGDSMVPTIADADVEIFRTDMHGTIIARSDGKNVTITTTKKPSGSVLTPGSAAAAAATIASSKPSQSSSTVAQQQASADITYIGNLKSKKFHLPTCKTLPDEQNRIFFDTRQAAVDAGYKPCGNCKP